jgi:hypothetical protein
MMRMTVRKRTVEVELIHWAICHGSCTAAISRAAALHRAVCSGRDINDTGGNLKFKELAVQCLLVLLFCSLCFVADFILLKMRRLPLVEFDDRLIVS